MLGAESLLRDSYVNEGTLKMVFWPVLNHGNPSVYSTIAAHCAGKQDPALFWGMHDALFENQSALWQATQDYYVSTAVSLGLDQIQFETCYNSPEALAEVKALDAIRLERGIQGQPIFDIGGQFTVAGAYPYKVYAGYIEAVLNG